MCAKVRCAGLAMPSHQQQVGKDFDGVPASSVDGGSQRYRHYYLIIHESESRRAFECRISFCMP